MSWTDPRRPPHGRPAPLAACLLALIVALTLAARADLETSEVLAEADRIDASTHPDADVVLVDDLISTRYEADGTERTRDDTWLKVLTEKGRREVQVLTFPFSQAYGTTSVVRLEVHRNGQRMAFDPAAQCRVVTERSQMDDNIYDPQHKVLQVIVPDLQAGDVLRYTAQSAEFKSRMPGTWSDYQVFESTWPIHRLTYEVSAPPTLPLRHAVLRGEVTGTVTRTAHREGDRTVHRWTVRGVPRLFEEPGMPELHTVAQRLLVSTIPDWETVSRWYAGLCEKPLRAVSPEMEEQVRQSVAGTSNATERVRRLFTFVSQQIRYTGITTEEEAPGYEPREVGVTFSNRYGVCRDKAALLVALLRLADIPAHPVLIHAGPRKDPGVPQPYFNHAVVAAEPTPGAILLMDPTDENSADLLPSYLCHKSYLVARPEGDGLRTSPLVPASSNLLRAVSGGRLERDGSLWLETELRFEGANDNAYRNYLARQPTETRRRFFDAQLGRLLPGSRLESFVLEPADLRDTTQPLVVRWTARSGPEFPAEGNRHRLIRIPWLGTSFGMVNFIVGQTGLEHRRFPLATDLACGVEETWSLDLGEYAGSVLSAPSLPPVEAEDLAYNREVSVSGTVVTARGQFALKAVEYPPDRYDALKQALRQLEYADRQRLVLEADAAAAAEPEAEVLQRTQSVQVQDATRWVTTEKLRYRVLTYAGTKRLADIRVDYNPVWEEVELVEAVVTAPDGKVSRVSPQEINRMDAAWVGEAPRYPAARTMAVSLPGVEVGSVIDLTWRRSYRDRPFFSFSTSARGVDPVLEQHLEVLAPTSLALQVRATWTGSVATVEGQTRRAWSTAQEPGVRREENMPPGWTFLPSVRLSSGNWTSFAQEALGPLRKGLKEKQPDVRALVRALRREHRGGNELLRAVRDTVARRVRLGGPALGDLPLSILTPPGQTLREGYGTSRDRAFLYGAMLREAGFKPEFLLVSSGSPRDAALQALWQETPQGAVFDGVLVRVRTRDGVVLFNDTDQYAPLGATPHEGRLVLDEAGHVGPLAVDAQLATRSELEQVLRIEADGAARLEHRARHCGMAAAAINRQLSEQTPEERRRHVLERVAQWSQEARLEGDYEAALDGNTFVERLSMQLPRYAVRDGKLLYVTLPLGVETLLPSLPAERTQPYYRNQRTEVRRTCRVVLPEGRVLAAPEDLAWAGPGTSGDYAQRVSIGNDGLTVEQDLVIDAAVLYPHDYVDLRRLQEQILRPGQRTVLIELQD